MSPAPAPPLACADHPERPVHARCMACGKALCRECATEWDGINHCASCLRQRRAAATGRRSWLTVAVLVGLVAGLLVLHARLLAFFGAFAASGL